MARRFCFAVNLSQTGQSYPLTEPLHFRFRRSIQGWQKKCIHVKPIGSVTFTKQTGHFNSTSSAKLDAIALSASDFTETQKDRFVFFFRVGQEFIKQDSFIRHSIALSEHIDVEIT